MSRQKKDNGTIAFTQLWVKRTLSPIKNIIDKLHQVLLRPRQKVSHGLHVIWTRTRSLALYPIPHYDRWGLYPQAVIIVACLFSFQWWPLVPTVAIGFLGVVAVIMAVRADSFRRGEKVVYVLIAFALFIVEMRAVYRDRDEHDKQQSELRQRGDAARDAERESFAKLLQAGKDLFSNTQQIETLAKRSLENVTGGNSYAYVSPQLGYPEVPLVVWNNGDQVLSGVTLTIAHTQEPNWGESFFRPIFIGTIGPHGHAPVPMFLSPTLEEKSGQDNYWIMISAQNGTVSQSLFFRKAKTGTGWASSFLVDKPIFTHKKIKGEMTTITTNKRLMYRGWSDEPAKPRQ